MQTQKRSGGVSITPYQVLNFKESGTITGKLEGGGCNRSLMTVFDAKLGDFVG